LRIVAFSDQGDFRTSAVVRRFGFLVFFIAVVQAFACSAQPSNRAAWRGHYFLVVSGFQGPDNDVVHSHTFASFYSGNDLANGVIKPATISWLPATGVVQPFGSERGHNFTLAQTLRMACRLGRDVKSWGPYQIEPALYQRALRRIQLLKSGRVQYAMIDTQPGTLNCIDAAGDLTPVPLDSGIAWGFVASDEVVRHLSPYFERSGATVDALAELLVSKACR
jgi:hypothetical protein